jgi:formylglycine-generating enzyme required for sulfatase activity
LLVYKPETSEPEQWIMGSVAGFRVLDLAGRGGMGQVFKARATTTSCEAAPPGTLVAIKFPSRDAGWNEQAEQRFRQEITILQQLNHPAIVRYLADGKEAGRLYYVMEWVEGENLAGVLNSCRARGQLLPFDYVMKCLEQICAGLAVLHEAGLIHRDLKPANIMVSANGTVKILDMGIARSVLHDAQTTARLTGGALGSIEYMAPEQMLPSGKVDKRADIYALGMVVYEMLTGVLPRGRVRNPSELNSTAPGWFDDVVFKMMEVQVEARPGSVRTLITTLRNHNLTHERGTSANRAVIRASSGTRNRLPSMIVLVFTSAVVFLVLASCLGVTDRISNSFQGDITNSIGMKLVLIPKGAFEMGSTKAERQDVLTLLKEKKMPDWLKAEGPQHKVEISKPFYMGIYEVTQAQYEKVVGKNPSYFSVRGAGKEEVEGLDTSNFPVESVSWADAMHFCKELTAFDNKMGFHWEYRLPTEAEWEYACRGGGSSANPFHFGRSLSSTQANIDGNYPYGGAEKGPKLQRTCKVGSYEKNRFGLYDMHGNVWEWCSDWYGEDYYKNSSDKDPKGPDDGKVCVVRGGSWSGNSQHCRAAYRDGEDPGVRYNIIGFRVVACKRR